MTDPLSARFRLQHDAEQALIAARFEKVDTGTDRDFISHDGLVNAKICVSLSRHPDGLGPYYIELLA